MRTDCAVRWRNLFIVNTSASCCSSVDLNNTATKPLQLSRMHIFVSRAVHFHLAAVCRGQVMLADLRLIMVSRFQKYKKQKCFGKKCKQAQKHAHTFSRRYCATLLCFSLVDRLLWIQSPRPAAAQKSTLRDGVRRNNNNNTEERQEQL